MPEKNLYEGLIVESSKEKRMTMEVYHLPTKLAQWAVCGNCMHNQLLTTILCLTGVIAMLVINLIIPRMNCNTTQKSRVHLWSEPWVRK